MAVVAHNPAWPGPVCNVVEHPQLEILGYSQSISGSQPECPCQLLKKGFSVQPLSCRCIANQIVRGNLIGTPAFVYSFTNFAGQPFKIEFTNAGENYLFWKEFVYRDEKIAFSSEADVRCGKGVNVYVGAGWGNHIWTCVYDLRVAFIRAVIRRCTHRQKLPLKLLAAHLRMDRWTYMSAPAMLNRLALAKP